MKTLFIITLIILSFQICAAQTSDARRFQDYEQAKLEKGVAFAYWLFIPGGGSFYAKNNKEGIGFLIGDVALLGMFSKGVRTKILPLSVTIPALIALRIYELICAFKDVDNYNHILMISLGISEQLGKPAPTINLSLRF